MQRTFPVDYINEPDQARENIGEHESTNKLASYLPKVRTGARANAAQFYKLPSKHEGAVPHRTRNKHHNNRPKHSEIAHSNHDLFSLTWSRLWAFMEISKPQSSNFRLRVDLLFLMASRHPVRVPRWSA